MIRATLIVLMAGTAYSAALATVAGAPQASAEQARICQSVVSDEPGAKPYRLCMTRAEWDAKKIADSKNANRKVCHYQERPGTRFRSAKVCMTAAEWTNERLRNRQAVEQIQMRSCVPGGGC